MLPPEIPKPGDVIRADFMRRLIEWIKSDVIPRGDGTTITVSGNIIQTISRPVDAVSGGSAEYTGYFKLVLLEENETGEDGESVRKYSVAIVDGATYDPDQTPVSGNSVCKVNNVTFSLDPYQSGEITETSVFALRYTAPIEANESAGTESQAEKVEIVNLTEEGYSYLPSDTSKICYYQLGRAIVTAENDGSIRVTIQQDHNSTASNGIPQIFRYALCGE